VKELAKKIYIGNLSFETTEEQVKELLAEFGKVDSVIWVTDRDSGRFRGFCFVEMEESVANAAIKGLNEKMLNGRQLRVNEARPRDESGGGGGRRRRNKSPNTGGRDRW